jgi:beta-propeller repeat-containing protein
MLSRPFVLNLLMIGVLLFSVSVSAAFAAASLNAHKTWGGSGSDGFTSVAVDSLGNIYAAGYTYSFGAGSPSYPALVLVKYSSAGSLLWQRIWTNGSNLYTSFYSISGVAVDSSGNVYVTGAVSELCNNVLSATIFLVKFNSTGGLQWQEAVSSCTNLSYSQIAIATGPSGAVYVVGETYKYGAGSGDILLLKFSSAGVIQQEKTWGGSNTDYPTHLTVDSSGNVFIVGGTSSFGTNGVLLKIDPTLSSVLFQKMINIPAPSGVGVDSAGNTYIASSINSGGYSDALVVKFDSTSGFQWAKTWGGTNGTDVPTALAVDPSGNALIAGWTTSYGEGGRCGGTNICFALFTAKLNTTGGLISQFVYGGLNYTQANAIALDGSGNAAIVGSINGLPPNAAGSGNNTLGSVTPAISSFGNSTLGPASYTTYSLTGTVGTPSGSESYAGSTDGLFLKYGSPSSSPVSPISILLAALLTSPVLVLYKRRRH